MRRIFIIFAIVLLGISVAQAQTTRKEINPIGFKLIYGACSSWAQIEGKKTPINVMQIPGEVIQRAAKSEQDKELAKRIQETYQITISPRGGKGYIERIIRKMRYDMGDGQLKFKFQELYKQRMERAIAHRKCYIFHRPADEFYPQEWLVVIDDSEDSKESFAKSKEPFVMTCLVGDQLTMDDVLSMISVPKQTK